MGVCADWADLYAPSFGDRMADARDAAFHSDRSRPLARVLDRPGPLVEYWPVAHVADVLGVSQARVKVLAATGRFGRCKRPRTGKGSPWMIPAHWQPDNTYRILLGRGKRGPKLRALALSPTAIKDPVPF